MNDIFANYMARRIASNGEQIWQRIAPQTMQFIVKEILDGNTIIIESFKVTETSKSITLIWKDDVGVNFKFYINVCQGLYYIMFE